MKSQYLYEFMVFIKFMNSYYHEFIQPWIHTTMNTYTYEFIYLWIYIPNYEFLVNTMNSYLPRFQMRWQRVPWVSLALPLQLELQAGHSRLRWRNRLIPTHFQVHMWGPANYCKVFGHSNLTALSIVTVSAKGAEDEKMSLYFYEIIVRN
jgi:hypothetical protein